MQVCVKPPSLEAAVMCRHSHPCSGPSSWHWEDDQVRVRARAGLLWGPVLGKLFPGAGLKALQTHGLFPSECNSGAGSIMSTRGEPLVFTSESSLSAVVPPSNLVFKNIIEGEKKEH